METKRLRVYVSECFLRSVRVCTCGTMSMQAGPEKCVQAPDDRVERKRRPEWGPTQPLHRLKGNSNPVLTW